MMSLLLNSMTSLLLILTAIHQPRLPLDCGRTECMAPICLSDFLEFLFKLKAIAMLAWQQFILQVAKEHQITIYQA